MKMKVVLIGLLVMLGLTANYLVRASDRYENGIDPNELTRLVNEWRMESNLSTLSVDPQLCTFAQQRLIETSEDWSHEGFRKHTENGQWCGDCILGENLAREYSTEEEILQAWESSPEHKEQMGGNYHETCIVTNGVRVVQLFR